MSQLKMQKLLYYCQAASLAWTGTPMFGDAIEAWINGPVVVSFWNNHRYEGWITAVPEGGELHDHVARQICDRVYDHYKALQGWQLRDISHQEKPWIDARGRVSRTARSNAPITTTAMLKHYRETWT